MAAHENNKTLRQDQIQPFLDHAAKEVNQLKFNDNKNFESSDQLGPLIGQSPSAIQLILIHLHTITLLRSNSNKIPLRSDLKIFFEIVFRHVIHVNW